MPVNGNHRQDFFICNIRSKRSGYKAYGNWHEDRFYAATFTRLANQNLADVDPDTVDSGATAILFAVGEEDQDGGEV
jgi:hypothetical protein